MTSHQTQTAASQTARLMTTAANARQTGATASRRRIARDAFENALRALVAQEDLHGVDSAAWVADNLTAARQAAQRTGLLTAEDVCRIEAEVVA